jgi:phage FluMu gp28-like protein
LNWKEKAKRFEDDYVSFVVAGLAVHLRSVFGDLIKKVFLSSSSSSLLAYPFYFILLAFAFSSLSLSPPSLTNKQGVTYCFY